MLILTERLSKATKPACRGGPIGRSISAFLPSTTTAITSQPVSRSIGRSVDPAHQSHYGIWCIWRMEFHCVTVLETGTASEQNDLQIIPSLAEDHRVSLPRVVPNMGMAWEKIGCRATSNANISMRAIGRSIVKIEWVPIVRLKLAQLPAALRQPACFNQMCCANLNKLYYLPSSGTRILS